MKVYTKNQQSDLPVSAKSIRFLVREVVAYEGRYYDEVTVHLVETAKISALHEQFFGDPTTTDCISFPLDDELMGDVFVCPETAIRYSQKNGIDEHEELSLYVVHGLLHLMGYDDLNPKDKRKMRTAEKRHLKHLMSLNLILSPKAV